MKPFEPYPENAEVHDSFATVPVEDADEPDGDDSQMAAKPSKTRTLLGKLSLRG